MRLIPTMTLAAMAMFLAGCNIYPEYRAKEEIREKLKDPESAQFKDLRISGSGLLVCGKINARNSMGGYVGFQDFMFYDGTLYSDDEFRSGLCCRRIETAVREHKNSSEVPGFAEACQGMIDGVRWD